MKALKGKKTHIFPFIKMIARFFFFLMKVRRIHKISSVGNIQGLEPTPPSMVEQQRW